MNTRIKNTLAWFPRVFWTSWPIRCNTVGLGLLLSFAVPPWSNTATAMCVTWISYVLIYFNSGYQVITARRRIAKIKRIEAAGALAQQHIAAMTTPDPTASAIRLEARFEQMEAAVEAHRKLVEEFIAEVDKK